MFLETFVEYAYVPGTMLGSGKKKKNGVILKERKCLCPPGTSVLENMQINTCYIEGGKDYEEKSSWARVKNRGENLAF